MRDVHTGLCRALLSSVQNAETRPGFWQHRSLAVFPQIAGSYRGSYFSMTGLADPRNCQMVVMPLPPCLPSVSPFMISILGCSWLPLPPSFLRLSPLMISILGCSWLPLLPCLPSLSPLMSILGCSWRRPPQLSPKLVSLHDLHSGLLLVAAAAFSSKLVSLPKFLISLLGCLMFLLSCSWLPLAPSAEVCVRVAKRRVMAASSGGVGRRRFRDVVGFCVCQGVSTCKLLQLSWASSFPCRWGVCVEAVNRLIMGASSGGVVVLSSFLHRKFPAVGAFVWRWSIAV